MLKVLQVAARMQQVTAELASRMLNKLLIGFDDIEYAIIFRLNT
jgi:hypothetical protein